MCTTTPLLRGFWCTIKSDLYPSMEGGEKNVSQTED